DEDALPDWIEEAMPHLMAMCHDMHWTSLLLKWVELERQLGFLKSRTNQLSTTSRPAQIGIWLHNSRPWNGMPFIGPNVVEDYSISWWLWWRSLQPTWRVVSLSRNLRDSTGEFTWQETRKGSASGFYLVILSLGWWRQGLGEDREAEWWCGDAMKDVEWVLDQM
ncbi:hypothetical protein FIBSPDRAFT_698212, partial [Athelia psychrophila]